MDREKLKEILLNMPYYSAYVELVCQKDKEALAILSANLDDTINYFDTCSNDEFYWCGDYFLDLADVFQSQRLVECVERNIAREPDKYLKSVLQMNFEYMKKHMKQ